MATKLMAVLKEKEKWCLKMDTYMRYGVCGGEGVFVCVCLYAHVLHMGQCEWYYAHLYHVHNVCAFSIAGSA